MFCGGREGGTSCKINASKKTLFISVLIFFKCFFCQENIQKSQGAIDFEMLAFSFWMLQVMITEIMHAAPEPLPCMI